MKMRQIGFKNNFEMIQCLRRFCIYDCQRICKKDMRNIQFGLISDRNPISRVVSIPDEAPISISRAVAGRWHT
jgi:hypothetical protein